MAGKKKNLSFIFAILLVFATVVVIIIGKFKEEKLKKENQALAKQYYSQESKGNSISSKELSKLNVYDKLKEKKDIDILVIGDGIGQGDGADNNSDRWHANLKKSLEKEYGANVKFEFLTAPMANVFRGWNDYIINQDKNGKTYDMYFIFYGQNDKGTLKLGEFQGVYESLIRKIKEKKGNAEIIPIIESSLRNNESFPNAIKKISDYYNLKYIDTREHFKNSNKPYQQLTKGGILPNKEGYIYYSEPIFNLIKSNLKAKRTISYNEKSFLFKNTENFLSNKFISDFNNIKGFIRKDNLLVGKNPRDYGEMKFEGSILGLSLLCDKNSGIVKVFVDNELIDEIDAYNSSELNKYILLTASLEKKQHNLRVEISRDKNPRSNGNEIKIMGVITN